MLVEILKTVPGAPHSIFQSRPALLAENLVLRQQIIVLQRFVTSRLGRRAVIDRNYCGEQPTASTRR
jgi:hypothetical protein